MNETGVDGEAAASASEVWEARYNEAERIWSGRPNAALVTEIAARSPGRALDLGCGEGADSVWLARQGWTVTGFDVSSTALSRAALAAEDAGVGISIRFRALDLAQWHPADDERFDLVSACFLHSPDTGFPRTEVLRRAAAAVAPGGLLLVVGHAGPPPWMDAHRAEHHTFLTARQEADALALGDDWAILTLEERPREATSPDGQPAELTDTIVLARRER